MTFFVTLLILVMQFLWKYVEDLVGKGLEWYVIVELLVYASASLVTMALPLAILLSSIMTFGNLGENYELVAMKSAGISLQRIMRPLIIFSIISFIKENRKFHLHPPLSGRPQLTTGCFNIYPSFFSYSNI